MEPDVLHISRRNILQENTPATEVFLLNFGGPQKAEEVEPFLVKIFEDRFIIRAPLGRLLRRLLARRIARQRTPETVRQYRAIGYSPINAYTQRQADYLQKELRTLHPKTRVRVINRYTSPFAHEVLPTADLIHKRLFLLPLYPQFCHSTTSSSIQDTDVVIHTITQQCLIPSVKIFSWWHNHMFLDYSWRLLADALETIIGRDGQIHVVFSAHGIPQSYALRGDPYPQEICAHYHALCERGRRWVQQKGVGSDKVQWHLSFQSRVGPVEWLKPYTTDVITNLDREKGGHLIMVPISFISDHIETLYEMDITYRELALQNSFATYARVRCPNDDPQLAMCLKDILLQHGF
jgi:ferrochelatase